jgi:C4-dicarboxylate transporter DctM subunit
MISLSTAVFGFIMMLGFMVLGWHVGVAMLVTSFIGVIFTLGINSLNSFGTQLWSTMNDFLLTAIPLFVLLGEILLRSGVTDRMYGSLSLWLSRLPGGLLHTNIGTSAVFAAVSGSSVATAATISTVALPEFRKRNYSEKLVLGSIASGATLGILIPPSVNMIIFGAITNTSIGQLFAGGIIPGIILTLAFMMCIIVIAKIYPKMVDQTKIEVSLAEKLKHSVHLLPPLFIFSVTMGSIYTGWATPSEAAGMGVISSMIIAAVYRKLNFKLLNLCILSTMRTTALCFFIIIAAFYLNFVVGVMGIPQQLTNFVSEIGTTPLQLILVLILFYLVLGCFIETLSMMVGTIPIVFPLILHLGIDPVWFGIFLVLMMEISLITPPVGMNIYVVQGVRGHGSVKDIFVGVAPFVLTMILFILFITMFPNIVTWLPNLLFN